MANRRFQGEDASEQIGQSSVHAGDMFQVRTRIGTIYDADKGMSFAELKGGFVATCTTAGATIAKVASIANYPDFQLKNGMEVLCYFANANAATSPTFNLAGTGAYPLALENQASDVNIGEGCWGAGVFLHLRYVDLTVSGTRIQKWIILGHNVASQNTSSSSGYTIYADGKKVYEEKSVTVSGNTFNGNAYVKKNQLYIIGEIKFTSPITAYSSLVLYIDGLNSKACGYKIKPSNNAFTEYNVYSGGGQSVLTYSQSNIPAGTYWINTVIQLS